MRHYCLGIFLRSRWNISLLFECGLKGAYGLKKVSLIVKKNHPVAISLYKKMEFVISGEVKEIVNGEELEFYKMIKHNEIEEGE